MAKAKADDPDEIRRWENLRSKWSVVTALTNPAIVSNDQWRAAMEAVADDATVLTRALAWQPRYQTRDGKRIAFLVGFLELANQLYYVQDAPELSDEQYDKYLHELKDLEARNPTLVAVLSPTQRVGALILTTENRWKGTSA